MESDDGGLREDAGEGAEAGERADRIRLREGADGRGGARRRVVRGELRGGEELPFRRDRPAEVPERDPVDELRVRVPSLGEPRELAQLLRGRQPLERRRRA